MELLSRELQRRLLERLGDAYPSTLDQGRLQQLASDREFTVNLAYLDEHGLVEVKLQHYLSDRSVVTAARITAKGIDFLADDGGLGAVLGVVTVRLHEDTVRNLLIQRVSESKGDETVKAQLVSQIKKLPAESVSKLAESAVESGLRHLPNALQWLQATMQAL